MKLTIAYSIQTDTCGYNCYVEGPKCDRYALKKVIWQSLNNRSTCGIEQHRAGKDEGLTGNTAVGEMRLLVTLVFRWLLQNFKVS